MKQDGLSKFIENAVRAHIFRCTVQDIKARNANADPEELQALIDNTVYEVRAQRRAKLKRNIALESSQRAEDMKNQITAGGRSCRSIPQNSETAGITRESDGHQRNMIKGQRKEEG
jgi:hypothetical protein